MLFIRKRLLRCAHLWYDDPPPVGGVDFLVYNQAPIAQPGISWEQKTTLILDLTKPEAELWSGLKKTYRTQIRSSLKAQNLVCRITDRPDSTLREHFYDYFDRFARSKGLPTVDRILFEEMAHQGQLALAWAQEAAQEEGSQEPLVFMSHLIYGSRARGLYSASQRLWEPAPERQKLIGRANRLLIWEVIRWAQDKGLQTYDFGGWYSGTEDPQRLTINQFKDGFRGSKLIEFEAVQGVTILGKMGVFLRKHFRGPGA